MKLTLEINDGIAVWKNESGETVCKWDESASFNYPEDLTSGRTIGSLVESVYKKGFEDGSNEN